MAGQVGISGSVKIGDGVVFAGQSGAVDNVEIGNGAVICGQAMAINDVQPGKHVFLSPAIDRMEALRVTACTHRLPKMMEEFKKLTARVDKLEASKDNCKPDGDKR
jgi:UDP-3-O-[3-hydroxymyristoyl] glucosamine N-acyltransferase